MAEISCTKCQDARAWLELRGHQWRLVENDLFGSRSLGRLHLPGPALIRHAYALHCPLFLHCPKDRPPKFSCCCAPQTYLDLLSQDRQQHYSFILSNTPWPPNFYSLPSTSSQLHGRLLRLSVTIIIASRKKGSAVPEGISRRKSGEDQHKRPFRQRLLNQAKHQPVVSIKVLHPSPSSAILVPPSKTVACPPTHHTTP